MSKWVYSFGAGHNEGRAVMRDLLGAKGAGLAEMATIGLPVPPGFTVTTEVCNAFIDTGAYPAELRDQVEAALRRIETAVGRRFGDPAAPLLVSVRSGARASMPGMMDTVLNLGLNDETVDGLGRAAGDTRFAWDSYRRFVQMYGAVVLGVESHRFEEVIEQMKLDRGGLLEDTELAADDWREVVAEYKALVLSETGTPFPDGPRDQLWGAVAAVFASWMNPRAKTYRRLHEIPVEWGTAVNVQAMVFGNMGADCATGVCFTRDPSTGENAFFGEYLANAQGEDVVSGIRTPQPLSTAQARDGDLPMETALPEAYAALLGVRDVLERHYRDMQDIEFTVERNKLYMLQTRSGKRSAAAALRIAVEMASDGLITREQAIGRVSPASLDQLLHPALDPAAPRRLLARGLPASPGAASGAIVFTAEEAEAAAARGEASILVRMETSPEDIHGMHAARGVLTTRGGMTSHAAVVARGMGRPCVTGAGAIAVDPRGRTVSSGGTVLRAGDVLTVDGATGEVFLGAVATVEPTLSPEFATLMGWADAVRRLRVRANADTPADAEIARRFGAEGIGLCRTEHMFFPPERIGAMRQMIMAHDEAGRRDALDRLLPFQRADFTELFRIMTGWPVTIRLFDPPLNEFLPREPAEIEAVAASLGVDVETVRRRGVELTEANPMLGHRGCRLGITYPEIYAMQVRAIAEGAVAATASGGDAITIEIMIPLVGTRAELAIVRASVEREIGAVEAAHGVSLRVEIGTMIELPRAALVADRIAEVADFFSFGTNDLTQTTFGFSRDDAGKFLPYYVEAGIVPRDPFVSLDADGVGALIRLGVEKGRRTRPDIKLGICGEHGGDPASIGFCERIGLDYVSCSPFRVPIARLAAAQAALTIEPDLAV